MYILLNTHSSCILCKFVVIHTVFYLPWDIIVQLLPVHGGGGG